MATAVEQRKREYELTEPEYIDHRVESEIRNYERALETEKRYMEQVSDKRPKEKEKVQWKIKMWENQLARLKSGEWKKVNASYLHEHYAKMLKKAISTGQPVPQPIIDQAPEYRAAKTSRERYEKGWKTSFANRSVAINEQMKEHLGYKVKRQDGTPITSAQLEEIATGVGDVESVLGPLHDLFDKTDITIVHTSGKHPFLSGFGGTYTSHERAVNIGVAGCKALGHELGHWLDFESGKAEHLTSRIYSKAGKGQEITAATESWEGRYKDQKPTALGQLIENARYKINKMREVREYMKADYGKDKTADEKEHIKLVREQLTPYWREPREIWARLVEQYIATRNGKASLATDGPESYEHRPGWWTKEDFATMMPQVEALIKARVKALRGSDVAPPRKGHTAEKKLEEVAREVKLLEGPKTSPAVVVGELTKPQPVVPAAVILKPVEKMIVAEQAGALGVPGKVHTQKGIGKPVTASMDAQIKLQAARAENQEAKEVVKEVASEVAGPLGTLSHEDATELVAGLDLRIDSLAGKVDEGQATLEAMKEELDPAVAKLTELIPTTKEGKGEITHITIGQYQKVWGRPPKPVILTKDGKRVRWEYALDEIAQQLHLEQKAQAQGKAPDEYLKGLIEKAKGTKALIRATEVEVESDKQTIKALEKLKETIKGRAAKETTGPLLQKIARPRVKPSAKPKPITRAKVILASVAQDLIQKTQAQRSPRAVLIDNALLARQVVPLTRVEVWVKHPNRVDLQGIDMPRAPGHQVKPGVGYGDRGKARLSRTHHKGFSRVKFS